MGRDFVQMVYEGGLDRLLRDCDAERVSRTFTVSVDFAPTFDSSGRIRVDPPDHELPYHFESHDGTKRCWSQLVGHEDEEEATRELAWHFQDDLLQELWGTAWPSCPGHPHPADPLLHGGVATWCCPLTGDLIARIGELNGVIEGRCGGSRPQDERIR